jgi:enamine deaminase RidA (YjgF/YER057c/UK114 family)
MRAMDESAVLQRLGELGLELPPVNPPVASYIPVTVAGTLAFVAGQVPMIEGKVVAPGHLGQDVTVGEAQDAAARAALQAISHLRAALGSLDRVVQIVQVTVYIAAVADFVEHPQVANGASDLFVSAFGDAGAHARAAVGMSSLPLGASVEIALTAEITPG